MSTKPAFCLLVVVVLLLQTILAVKLQSVSGTCLNCPCVTIDALSIPDCGQRTQPRTTPDFAIQAVIRRRLSRRRRSAGRHRRQSEAVHHRSSSGNRLVRYRNLSNGRMALCIARYQSVQTAPVTIKRFMRVHLGLGRNRNSLDCLWAWVVATIEVINFVSPDSHWKSPREVGDQRH